MAAECVGEAPTDNFGSSLARVMGAYGYDHDSLQRTWMWKVVG